MKVLVDTSVWVEFLNGTGSPEARLLERALQEGHDVATCGVIVAELFQGIKDAGQRQALEKRFRSLLYLEPVEPESYFDAAALFRKLRQHGRTIRSTIDCLIAVLAAEAEARILAKDRDFDHILDSGLWPVERLKL